jgi:predicted transcriptional regulator
MPKPGQSSVLTIRVPRDVERRLSREARRQRRTRSEVARAILQAGLSGAPADDPRAEARRQSELATASAGNDDTRQFIVDAADLRGWK